MRDLITIGTNQIVKHFKYENQYKPESKYWGLGIEVEVYLEFDIKKKISEKEFLQNHKKERYSIDYYSNYSQTILPEAFGEMLRLMGSKVLFIPVLLNSHSFTKTDRFNNSKTLYTTNSEPNKKFEGKTLIEYLAERDSYFNQENPTWIFDGDTIEFISVNFFNSKLADILDEVELNKKIFIKKLNKQFEENKIFESYGKIKIMEQNYPFAKYLTNLNNIGMFNNGTIHFNITLPTKLDLNSKIKNKEKFIKKHKNAIKIIQWLEPLIIGVYGSPDPFATLSGYKDKNKFSNCSQRNVISRYISIGTFNTDLMESGKILTKPIDTLVMNKLDFWWYKRIHGLGLTNGLTNESSNITSAYSKLGDIGLDINFNKHWNHGIEIRFLDYINDKKLVQECFEFIIYLMDFSLANEKLFDKITNPIINESWNNLVYMIFIHGINLNLNEHDKSIYELLFSIKIKSTNIVDVYYEIFEYLKKKFNKEFIESNDELVKANKINKLIVPSGLFSSLVLENKQTQSEIINPITNSTPDIFALTNSLGQTYTKIKQAQQNLIENRETLLDSIDIEYEKNIDQVNKCVQMNACVIM
jgi:hypothetical protein